MIYSFLTLEFLFCVNRIHVFLTSEFNNRLKVFSVYRFQVQIPDFKRRSWLKYFILKLQSVVL
ncbi:hypothetical protein B1J93_01640 [Leptospira kirschneri serovar Pomona]|uniref:Uncharacterized protein n=1 Tax=Leptospira kirschneri serovar Pomona TaxID=561005 RepID=A0A1T1E2J1_9LEPT|nr:hypothetical protein B1J93_01640 [Leptospira kirschneri serovar Pomona]